MNRQKLTDAIAEALENEGFEFHTGFDYRIAPEVRKLPAAWLHHPALLKKEGRREGYSIYSVKIELIVRYPKPPQTPEDVWDTLESKANAVCALVRKNPAVQQIDGIRYLPAEMSLTAKNEISLTLSFNARVPFCDYCDDPTP